MRVTDSMFFNNMKRSVAQRQSEYAEAQQRAVTGRRVDAPSDDPFAFAEARTESANLNRHQGYERTIGMARPQLEAADGALGSVDNILGRVRDIAIQGANDVLTTTDRQTLSQELTSLRDQLVTLGNSQAGDRYIFGGYKDNVPPYDAAGVYSGDTNSPSVEVARGVNLPLGITGDRIFGAAGADVFTAITNLQTALGAGIGADIDDVIPEIDARLESVRTARSQFGIHLNAADVAQSVAIRNQDRATISRSNLIEIDQADAYSDLIRAQTALNAAIEIAAQLPPQGLVGRSR